jgi:hypothetical protein
MIGRMVSEFVAELLELSKLYDHARALPDQLAASP